MPPKNQYNQVFKQRQKQGLTPHNNSSMKIEGAGILDESGPKFPSLPTKTSPTLPTQDPFLKLRTEQA